MLVVAFRSLTYFGLIVFIPLYLRHKDILLRVGLMGVLVEHAGMVLAMNVLAGLPLLAGLLGLCLRE